MMTMTARVNVQLATAVKPLLTDGADFFHSEKILKSFFPMERLHYYEIEHMSNPLIRYSEPMQHGRLVVSSSVVHVMLHFANGASMSFDTSIHKMVDIGDDSSRYWWRLQPKSYYDQNIIRRIADTNRNEVVLQPTLYEMLYDLIHYKIVNFKAYKKTSFEQIRKACAKQIEMEYNDVPTAEDCEGWADRVLAEGWERCDGGRKLTRI